MTKTLTYHYAGFWRRLVAVIVDSLILGLVTKILGLDVKLYSPFDSGPAFGFSLAGLLIATLYFAGFESSKWQATPGKKAMGIMVQREDSGRRLTGQQAAMRFLLKLLSAFILMIGFIMAAFTKKKQGLHDILAGTIVVNDEPEGTKGS